MKIGDKVRVYGDRENIGTLTAKCKGAVTVTFDDGQTYEGELSDVKLHDPEADAAIVQQIQMGITEAERGFKALLKAQKLAEKNDFSLQDDVFDLSDLYGMMEDLGWSSSSLHC